MNKLADGVIAVLMAVVGIAIVVALVSPKAKTADVLTSGGNAFANIIKTALGPVT